MPPLDLPGQLFFADELTLPGGPRFLFKYDAFELCCALKPYALKHVIQQYGVLRLVYLDSDILVKSSFWHDIESSWEAYSVLVTPHLIRPPLSIPIETQRSLVQHGAYNAGFIGIKKSDAADAFITCWANLLAGSCTSDPMNGTFVDQRWLDLLVPSNEQVGTLRDLGCNVAYWNLCERKLHCDQTGQWFVSGRPLKFFHFSGFDPKRLSTKVDCRDPNALALAQEYDQHLRAAGQECFAKFPYGRAFYNDGRPIAQQHRDLILADVDELAEVTDPFALPKLPKAQQALEQLVCTTAPLRIEQRFRESDKASALLQRLYRHPVLGAVWRLWCRLINPSLQPYLPPDARR